MGTPGCDIGSGLGRICTVVFRVDRGGDAGRKHGAIRFASEILRSRAFPGSTHGDHEVSDDLRLFDRHDSSRAPHLDDVLYQA